MSRDLTSAMNAAIQDPHTQPIVIFWGEFNSGIGRMWTGVGVLDWDGQLWQGVGDLIAISDVEETNEIKASGISVSLSGVDPSRIAFGLNEVQRDRPGKIWFGLLDEDGLVIGDPKILFRGRCDTCVIEDGPETATVTVTYEHEMIDLERPKEIRYTDEEQRRLYPEDESLTYIAGMQDTEIRWGNNVSV